MMRPSAPGWIRTGFRSSMRYVLSGANYPSMALFPPQDRKAYHRNILDEVSQEHLPPRLGRSNDRGVKRKMSGYKQVRGRAIRRPCLPAVQIIK
jgi:hypothetical protein